MSRIRVMIVEDSRVVRELLTHFIGRDPRLEVAAAFESAEEALAAFDRVAPDVVSMDIRLPGMNGFEATQRIMALRPTPIVVVSASVEADDLKISMNALRAGALAVMEKPTGLLHHDYEAVAGRLCSQLVNMSQVKVIRQRIARKLDLPAGGADRGPWGPAPAAGGPGAGPPAAPRPALRILGVVASTGGPNALARFFADLPPDFPLPVVVVQHITASFLGGFVTWLAEVARRPAKTATDGEVPSAGTIYLPPADAHLTLEGGRLWSNSAPPVHHQRPSGSVLFKSMAKAYGPAGLGVLLTGMGEDGADGLRELRAAGGYTIAEDESTAVVWGMPGAAVRMKAACEVLPLPAVAPRVAELARGGRP